MSSMRLSSSSRVRPTAASPELCAQILGDYIRMARCNADRPIEELAPLAGLTVPEWKAIEAGQAPDTWEQICLIAAVLGLGHSWMPRLMRLYVGAQKN